MTTASAQLDELSINTIRTLSMDAVQKANSGHPGAPMALAPLAYLLYTRVMKHNPANADWFDRDRLVLSAGHASMLLYSSLYLSGYGLTLDDLKSFRQLGSATAGHPERGDAAGIEATTGPLGQGISMAVGLALAEAMLAARYNRPGHELIDHRTFAICSDGDMQEGVASEACSLAGHLGLGKLVTFYDNNHIQLAGETAMAFSEDVPKRFEAYGWHTQDLGEDITLERMEAALAAAAEVPDRPSLIVLRTHIGYGSPNKQDSYKAHGSPLGEDEVRLTKEAYGWDPDAHFLVPDEVLEHFRAAAGERGAQAEADWSERAAAYRSEHAEAWDELSLSIEGRMPDGWQDELPRFDPADGDMATRKASSQVIQWAASRIPNLISGSADLEPSTLTLIDDGGSVSRDDFDARNVHYGVREHAMGAVVNGLNLHGLRALRLHLLQLLRLHEGGHAAGGDHGPAVDHRVHPRFDRAGRGRAHAPADRAARASARHPEPVHDAPGGGERDRPGMALRAHPDPHAGGLRAQPPGHARAGSRRSCPTTRWSAAPTCVRDASSGEPDLILIGTGSELQYCLGAAELLEADGIAARVVSAPCLELFREQDDDYRDSVLPPAVRARLSVEAATKFGWSEWVTDDGDSVGMERFGASAPQEDLYEEFGFTNENVAARGRAVLERLGARA